MRIKNTEIGVVQGDITELKVDAIVNAANNKLLMGGGVAGAIKRKGGEVIEKEALAKAPIDIGAAVATSAGKLPSKYVIHAATMGMDFQTDEAKIRAACRSALVVAERLSLSSIAFPALGCGVGGFPEIAAAKIMSQEVFRYLRNDKVSLKEIFFCLYDKNAFTIFDQGVIGYLRHVTQGLQWGPFTTVDAIIEIFSAGAKGIVIIKRSNPPFGYALPGGFLDYGESLEEAVIREAREETGLDLLELRQFHTYSDPGRDPRFQTIGTVFIARAEGIPQAGDDAAEIKVIKLEEIEGMDFAFDHKKILKDYKNYKQGEDPFKTP